MKIKSTSITTPIISFWWIDFMETKVNDILLRNIVYYLTSWENKKNFQVLVNWLKEHKISRSWYRMIEFPFSIDNVEEFKSYLNSQDSFLSYFSYNNSGYFYYEGAFYLIVSKTEDSFDKKYDYISWHVKSNLPPKK